MYYLSECLVIKNENQYLIEHINCNYEAGVEHFYIYDNMSDEPVEEFLSVNAPDLLTVCTIKIFDSSDKDVNAIESAYTDFMDNYKEATKWCAFIDTDEMFSGNLKSLCESVEDTYSCIKCVQEVHGANHKAYSSNDSLWKRFGKDKSLTSTYYMYKCVAQTSAITTPHNHEPELSSEALPTLKILPTNDSVVLHHFYTKSLEEWYIKTRRGSVNTTTHYVVAPRDIRRYPAFKGINIVTIRQLYNQYYGKA